MDVVNQNMHILVPLQKIRPVEPRSRCSKLAANHPRQVSGALQELGVNHSMEVGSQLSHDVSQCLTIFRHIIINHSNHPTTVLQEKLQPYVADVRLTRRQRLIEIDGSLSMRKGAR